MKRIITISILLIINIITVQSCKKGENDPLFSLSTRSNRLSGNWEVVKEEIKETITKNNVGDTSYVINSIYNGTYKATATQYSILDTTFTHHDTIYYKEEIKFTEDGKYFKSFKMSDNSNTIETEGNWIFLGKSEANNLKNKEALLLTTTKHLQTDGTTTNINNYTNTDGITYVINQLKNKELILTVDKTYRNDEGLNLSSISVKTTYEVK